MLLSMSMVPPEARSIVSQQPSCSPLLLIAVNNEIPSQATSIILWLPNSGTRHRIWVGGKHDARRASLQNQRKKVNKQTRQPRPRLISFNSTSLLLLLSIRFSPICFNSHVVST